MPRTPEHILECHKPDSALRKVGKPVWNKVINIKSIQKEDPKNITAEHVVSVSNRIGKLVRSRLPASFFDMQNDDYDDDFVTLIEDLTTCSLETLETDLLNGCSPEQMINMWLNELYDWADRQRIWLGS
jgi:hypothetical protein